jgi:hypothetical protein
MLFRMCIVRFVEKTEDENLLMSFSEECLISNDPGKYHYVAQGMLTIDNVDDAEEMRITDEAFDILGFTKVCIEYEKKQMMEVF